MLRILFVLPLCFAVVSVNAALVDPLHKNKVDASTCPLHEADVNLPYCVVPSDLSGDTGDIAKSAEHLKKEHVN